MAYQNLILKKNDRINTSAPNGTGKFIISNYLPPHNWHKLTLSYFYCTQGSFFDDIYVKIDGLPARSLTGKKKNWNYYIPNKGSSGSVLFREKTDFEQFIYSRGTFSPSEINVTFYKDETEIAAIDDWTIVLRLDIGEDSYCRSCSH